MRHIAIALLCASALAIAGPCWGQEYEVQVQSGRFTNPVRGYSPTSPEAKAKDEQDRQVRKQKDIASYQKAKRISLKAIPEPSYDEAMAKSINPSQAIIGSTNLIAAHAGKFVGDTEKCVLQFDNTLVYVEGFPAINFGNGDSVRVVDLVEFVGRQTVTLRKNNNYDCLVVKLLPPDKQITIAKEEHDRIYPEYKLKNGETFKGKLVQFDTKAKLYLFELEDGSIKKIQIARIATEEQKASIRKLQATLPK